MDEIQIEPLKSLLAPSILEWLTDEETSSSAFVDNCMIDDEFFESLPEAELAKLDNELEGKSSSTGEFKTTNEKELKGLVENNTNLNTKHSTSTWLKCYEKWAEHKGTQTDCAKVLQESLDNSFMQNW